LTNKLHQGTWQAREKGETGGRKLGRKKTKKRKGEKDNTKWVQKENTQEKKGILSVFPMECTKGGPY